MSKKIDNLLKSFLIETDKEEQESREVVWEEEPVSFEEFITSKEMMNFPPYSDRQLDAMNYLLGTDPKNTFNNGIALSVLCWGKGCLAKETILENALTREKYTIEELYKQQKSIPIFCYDEKTKKQTIEMATAPWIAGNGSIFEVKTESGKCINVFEHHQFYTKNGWKKLSELSIGDEILDDSKREISAEAQQITNEFKSNYIQYSEEDVKKYLRKKLEMDIPSYKRNKKTSSLYNTCLYEIMGSEWRKQKFGLQKEKHPLWGKHQSEESKKKNSESNKKALAEFYKTKRGLEVKEHFKTIFGGENNPMYGRPAPFGSGKCDYFLKENNFGEKFYLQGTWETKFADFLNIQNIYWKKNKDRFQYIDKLGHKRTYSPDFILFFENKEIYIEIKGLEDENVDIKLQAVKNAGKEIYIIREENFKKFYKNYKEPKLKFEHIVSITYLREDEYYDLEVNKYHNYLAHGLYNHNSGKDTISCHAVLYCVYLLLCCKNPYRLFRGIDASSYMDIVNVAYNKTQSTQVFFTKLVESVKNWKWLRNKYRYIESGKSKKLDKKYENEEIVNIKAEEIIFPKHIRAVSRCSQQNAAEGLNVLLFILDEFSAFSDKNNKSNAMEMFNTLRTSAITRFGNQAKGFVISFPRYQGDPILKLAEMYKDDLNVYVDIASTFEVKPKSCFCDKWVEWEGHLIPEDFLTDFIKDPENSKAKFLCQPPEMSDPFFTDTQRIDNSIDKEKKQLFEVRDKFIKDPINGIELIGKEIIGKNYNAPNIVYCIGGDIGYTNDLTAVTIWHKETLNTADGQEYSRIIQDCLITWKPNKDKKIQVDVANIEEVISDIIFKWKLPISGFYFDHYNTAALMQNFRKRGVNAQAYKLTVQDFYDIRTKLYSGNISFLDVEEQTREMKRLINTKQGKPDHISGDHDDMFRANCLAITMLDGDFKNRPIVMNDDGLFINKKLTIENGQIDNEFEGELVKGRFHNGGGVDFENFGFDDNYGDDDITI